MQNGLYIQYQVTGADYWVDYNDRPYGSREVAESMMAVCRAQDAGHSNWRLVDRTVDERILISKPASAAAKRSA